MRLYMLLPTLNNDHPIKNYNKLYGINSLKHVIVFFPADELYTITLKGDISLQNDAFKKGFIFSSPNNLNNLIAVFENISNFSSLDNLLQ